MSTSPRRDSRGEVCSVDAIKHCDPENEDNRDHGIADSPVGTWHIRAAETKHDYRRCSHAVEDRRWRKSRRYRAGHSGRSGPAGRPRRSAAGWKRWECDAPDEFALRRRKNSPSRAMAKGTRDPERMEPLSAAKIEIMAATLTAAAPGAPRIFRIISAATRSVDGHCAGRKHIEIGQIGQQINGDHGQGANNQRQRRDCAAVLAPRTPPW